MTDLYALKQELDNGHPITGPYSTNSKAAAEEINVDNRTHLIPLSSNELLAWAANSGDHPDALVLETTLVELAAYGGRLPDLIKGISTTKDDRPAKESI